MSWRIHLADRSVHSLFILPHEPPYLAASAGANRIDLYNLMTGTVQGFHTFEMPGKTVDFGDGDLQALGEAIARLSLGGLLPRVSWRGRRIFVAADLQTVLVWLPRDSLRVLRADGSGTILAEDILAVDIDRQTGIFATLDADSRLCVYQGGALSYARDLALARDPLWRIDLAICARGERIFVADGRQIIAVDWRSSALRRIETHYGLGIVVPPPSGEFVYCSDRGAGLIRVYAGDNLTQTHQRFAQDLIAEAHQVQLLADLPPTSAAVSAMAAGTDGEFAFAMSGVICMSSLSRMTRLP